MALIDDIRETRVRVDAGLAAAVNLSGSKSQVYNRDYQLAWEAMIRLTDHVEELALAMKDGGKK